MNLYVVLEVNSSHFVYLLRAFDSFEEAEKYKNELEKDPTNRYLHYTINPVTYH